ncbi:MAG: hypothetical protein IBJ10_00735 [Phycisphaerales bacterium]|nr:hypothetical protein [Phycisphaerales bacterium]
MSAPKTKAETKQQKIDEKMERASEALEATRYFECERLCIEALRSAHSLHDFDRMARILMPLEESRRQKRLAALDADRVEVLKALSPELKLRPGCYMLEPPDCVGVDGRALREMANAQEVPVLVVVREPLTRAGLWPLVAVGPVTVRVRTRPSKGLTPEWFADALEALGDVSLEAVDWTAPSDITVGELVDRLETCPEHDLLHQRLADACRAALKELLEAGSKRRTRKAKPPIDPEDADDED